MTSATVIHDIAVAAGLNVRAVKLTPGSKGYVSHRPAYADPTDITAGYTGNYTQALEALTVDLANRDIKVLDYCLEADGDGEYIVIAEA